MDAPETNAYLVAAVPLMRPLPFDHKNKVRRLCIDRSYLNHYRSERVSHARKLAREQHNSVPREQSTTKYKDSIYQDEVSDGGAAESFLQSVSGKESSTKLSNDSHGVWHRPQLREAPKVDDVELLPGDETLRHRTIPAGNPFSMIRSHSVPPDAIQPAANVVKLPRIPEAFSATPEPSSIYEKPSYAPRMSPRGKLLAKEVPPRIQEQHRQATLLPLDLFDPQEDTQLIFHAITPPNPHQILEAYSNARAIKAAARERERQVVVKKMQAMSETVERLQGMQDFDRIVREAEAQVRRQPSEAYFGRKVQSFRTPETPQRTPTQSKIDVDLQSEASLGDTPSAPPLSPSHAQAPKSPQTPKSPKSPKFKTKIKSLISIKKSSKFPRLKSVNTSNLEAPAIPSSKSFMMPDWRERLRLSLRPKDRPETPEDQHTRAERTAGVYVPNSVLLGVLRQYDKIDELQFGRVHIDTILTWHQRFNWPLPPVPQHWKNAQLQRRVFSKVEYVLLMLPQLTETQLLHRGARLIQKWLSVPLQEVADLQLSTDVDKSDVSTASPTQQQLSAPQTDSVPDEIKKAKVLSNSELLQQNAFAFYRSRKKKQIQEKEKEEAEKAAALEEKRKKREEREKRVQSRYLEGVKSQSPTKRQQSPRESNSESASTSDAEGPKLTKLEQSCADTINRMRSARAKRNGVKNGKAELVKAAAIRLSSPKKSKTKTNRPKTPPIPLPSQDNVDIMKIFSFERYQSEGLIWPTPPSRVSERPMSETQSLGSPSRTTSRLRSRGEKSDRSLAVSFSFVPRASSPPSSPTLPATTLHKHYGAKVKALEQLCEHGHWTRRCAAKVQNGVDTMNAIHNYYLRCREDVAGVDIKRYTREFFGALPKKELWALFNESFDMDRDGFLNFYEFTRAVWSSYSEFPFPE